MTPLPTTRSERAHATPSQPEPTVWWQQTWALVLAGGIIMGLALGTRHVQGLFYLPITMDRGWSRETFGLAMAIQNLTWGIAQPFTGMVADRFGSAKAIAAGVAFYAAGLYLMIHADTPASFIWSAGVCVGIGLSATTFGAVYGALSRLVAPERRSWALGLAGAIGGFAQFAMVPATQELLGGWGWSGALLVLSLLLLLSMPLARSLQDLPQSTTRADSELPLATAVREAFGHRGFWLLNLGFLACGFQLAFVATHLPAYLMDKGMRPADAVTALAIIALTNIFGTYYCGLLGVRHRRKRLLAGIYLVRTSAMALFVLTTARLCDCPGPGRRHENLHRRALEALAMAIAFGCAIRCRVSCLACAPERCVVSDGCGSSTLVRVFTDMPTVLPIVPTAVTSTVAACLIGTRFGSWRASADSLSSRCRIRSPEST